MPPQDVAPNVLFSVDSKANVELNGAGFAATLVVAVCMMGAFFRDVMVAVCIFQLSHLH